MFIPAVYGVSGSAVAEAAPHHHLHISTPALFFAGLFVVAMVAIIFAFIRSMKRDRIDAEAARQAGLGWRSNPPSYPEYRDGGIVHSSGGYVHTTPAAPVYYGAPVYAGGMDPGLAMVEGMLIGEALSHHHDTTVIHDGYGSGSTTYVDSSPSYDSGISYDSGSSYSDSGSSYDSGGGVDISW